MLRPLTFALLAAVSAGLPVYGQTSPAAAPAATAPPAGFSQAIKLWPNAAPISPAEGRAATSPTLFSYPAPGPGPHAAVIVMPGGGYTHLVMEGEGAAEARFLAAHNISAFVLAYRLAPAYPFPAPMLDAARALRYVRAHAAELGVLPDHIALWGFSAGGHLTAWMSVNKAAPDPDFPGVSARPDAAIISYGRFDLSPAGPHPDPAKTPTMQSVLHATTVDLDILPKVSAAGAAGLIPPTFLYSTSGDQTVDSRNASNYYTGLKAANIPAELHIFELGPHGTHMGMDRPPAEHELTILPVLLLNWLEIHGWNPTLSDPAK